MVFPTYELDCKNAGSDPHQIDIPLPSQLTLGGSPPSRDHIRNVAFACPRCQQVHSYDGGDLKHRVIHASLDQMPPIPVPVKIRTVCDRPGCGAVVTIYTTRQPAEKKEDVLVRMRGAAFHITCKNGHVPGGGWEGRCEISDGPLCNPF